MAYKSITLGLGFEQVTPSEAPEDLGVETYAVEFCARQQAHLIVCLTAPIFTIPSAGLLGVVHALVDEVNADRRARAEAAERRLANAAAIAGITAEFHIIQDPYSGLDDALLVHARTSDIVLLPRGEKDLTLDRDLVDTMLFKSGRPIITVPPNWERSVRFDKIMVAWDGGAKAARAVGDALGLLAGAAEVEILCVTPDAEKSIKGADLAAHLARHCGNVTLTELPLQHGDIARTLRAHAAMGKADLLVMGAYAHSRLLEVVLGGVTRDMLSGSEVPLFLSY